MKKLRIKRWMFAAGAGLVLTNATGCSLKKNKCPGNHVDENQIYDSAYSNGSYYYGEKTFTSAIRENFFGNHELVTNEMFLEEHGDAISMDYKSIFDKVQKRAKKEMKNINEEALDNILDNYSIVNFLDYIVASEGKNRGKYFSKKDNEKIVEMFLSNLGSTASSGMYMLKSGTHNKGYEFKLEIDHPDGRNLSECIIETVKNEIFACDKVEKIKGKVENTYEETYNINQTYKIEFYNEKLSFGDKENITLKLENNWEILNGKRKTENFQCEEYLGNLSLKYKHETIEEAVSEEKYEELAEVIVIAVNNNNTKDEFLKENKGILEEIFGDNYKKLNISKENVLIKKSNTR